MGVETTAAEGATFVKKGQVLLESLVWIGKIVKVLLKITFW